MSELQEISSKTTIKLHVTTIQLAEHCAKDQTNNNLN